MTEETLAEVLVGLAETVVGTADVQDFLHVLTARCVNSIPVSAAGVVVADGGDRLRLVAGAAAAAGHLELLELDHEGPFSEVLSTGQPVLDVDIVVAAQRWPRFAGAAAEVGVRTTSAFPLRFRGDVIGVLGLCDDRVRWTDNAHLGQTLADIAALALGSDELQREQRLPSQPLVHALESRAVVEQAKGVLAERRHIGVDEAFDLLRSYARGTGTALTDVARSVLWGELRLPVDAVPGLEHEGGPAVLQRSFRVQPSEQAPHPTPRPTLLPLDLRLLRLISSGLSGCEVAARADLSLADMAERLAQVRVLLDVDSTAAAVRAARRDRVI